MAFTIKQCKFPSPSFPRDSASRIQCQYSTTLTCTKNKQRNRTSPSFSSEVDLVSADTMLSNNARRMTTEAVKKTKMYVASKNGRIINWSDLQLSGPGECQVIASDKCDDGIHASPLDATSLLKLLPRGAYTTCRTIGRGTSVYQFEYHVKRLAASSASMITDGGVLPDGITELDPAVYDSVTNVDRVRDKTLSCVKKAVVEFRRQYGDRMFPCDEFRITLLQTWLPEERNIFALGEANEETKTNGDSGGALYASMYCHVGILPKRRDGEHIKVEVHGHGRNNAAAKDSQWINQRENSAAHGCEEYILVNDSGEMLEGTQTNFFLVTKDGCVLTAEDGILKGSVRDSVLRVCTDHGIPLELRPPTVNDLENASGAFLSSTSRLVLPIHEVVVNVSEDDVEDSPPTPATYHFPNCQVTKSIQELVMEDVKTHCVSLE